jgi:6-phosphofructokinase
MATEIGNGSTLKRIAIMVGAGYVPGINAVIIGAAMAADKMGWELVGIRDGFEGLLYPEKYPDGGLVILSPQLIDTIDPSAGCVLGQSPRVDPFNVRIINEMDMVEEVDMSDDLIKKLKDENIDSLISVVGAQGLTIIYKLHRKGLNTVCIPRSIHNDIASTSVSFGFNSALTFTIKMLDSAREGAQAVRKIVVVEVQGEEAGWIALQSGIAACADVVLIPEIPVDLKNVAEKLKEKISAQRPYALVVVAQGAKFINQAKKVEAPSSFKATLSPLATSESNSEYVIQSSGKAAETVATELQQLIAEETYPLVIGPWVRGSESTAVDRQLGIAYGAGALEALKAGKDGTMVAFVPPDIKFVPLAEAINKVRTVPADSELLKIAQSLGIYCGK